MEKTSATPPPGSADDDDHEESLPRQFIEHLERQKQIAGRRTILIVIAVLLVGAAVIGTVLGITLTKNESNSSTTMKPTLSPSLPPSKTSPVAPAFAEKPTSSPVVSSARPAITSPTFAAASLAPTTAILGVIQSVALNGGAEFLNTTSYQIKARSAVVLSNRVDEDWQVIQRYALGCIYFATYGVMHQFTIGTETKWKNSTGWLTSAEECTWYGIICNSDQRVVAINLARNRVTGTFPREVILLKDTLTVLNIGDNKIFNKDSEVVFLGQLTNLGKTWLLDFTVYARVFNVVTNESVFASVHDTTSVRLDIGNTYFTFNGLPPALGRLTKLTHLDVSYTIMFGPMRAKTVFSNLRSLEQIQMGGLAFNQSIPTEISNLPNLTRFYCDYSDITGSLDFIMDMPSIFEIWMDRNLGLKGTIPSAIGTKSTILQSISLTDCSLTGTIPSGMGNLVKLQQLWLSDNHLTGTIPNTLAGLPQFHTFDVSNNKLTGDLPLAMCNVTAVAWEELCVDCSEVECCCCSCCTSLSCPASG
jgi:Leucine-rich repeat (LRR) protein